MNLAGTLAGTSPIGVGLNASAAAAGTANLTAKWMRGELTPADVLQVTGSIMGTALAIAAVSGVPITATALLLAAGVSIVAGPGAKDMLNDVLGGAGDVISNTLGTTPDPLVKTIRYVDPLILDLDGDGLEITPLANGVLFDANGDTIKTGTAWAGADDGMLVWDRDGNGLIDSGRELFGDETMLANGQKAAHGFAALIHPRRRQFGAGGQLHLGAERLCASVRAHHG